MKKLFVTFVIAAMAVFSAYADQSWGEFFVNSTPMCVQFHITQGNEDDATLPVPRHTPALLPVLGYDGNTFVLATPYELEDVTIVIRDENGTVLYYDTVSSINDYYMFLLTDDVIADMFSIELYYGDRHLYGEF